MILCKLRLPLAALVAIMLLSASIVNSCSKASSSNNWLFPPEATPKQSLLKSPPPVEELDGLLAGAIRTASEGAVVVSFGSDYAPEGSGTTGSSPECIEPSGTNLNLRAYGPGEYSFGLFAQQIGDMVAGGGRDDEIPLSSLIQVSPCAFGGGRDDEIPLSFFMGFADYSAGAWRWFGPYGDPAEVSLYTEDLKNRFKSPSDIFYICVLTSSAFRSASAVSRTGRIGALPFGYADKGVSVGHTPVGVSVNQIATTPGLGDGTIPSIVTGFSAEMDISGLVTLTWDANPDTDVASYELYRSVYDSPLGWTEYELVAEVASPSLEYADSATSAMATYLYQICAVNETGAGSFRTASAGLPQTRVDSPMGLKGKSGESLQPAAFVVGSEPLSFAWDFGGGATPNLSFERSPKVILGAEGEYVISLEITNAFGSLTIPGQLSVLPPEPSWHNITVLSAGSVGRHTSLSVIDGSYAAITCSGDSGLQFVMAEDYYNAQAWRPPVVIESGGGIGNYSSLSTVGAVPALTYFGMDIRYCQATGYYGDAWNSPVTIAPLGDEAQGTSLCVVNGNPAATFFNNTPSNGLKFARANDAGGSTWGTPVLVDGTNAMTGYYSSLAVINGNPAIAYYGSGLKYIRATDANGAVWGTPVVIADGSTKGNFASLESVGGRPAIAYYEYLGMGNGARLMYVRALDANGTAWGTPQQLDTETGAGTGSWISMAIIGSKPAVSYANDQTANLMYVRALDAAGTAWGAPEVVDGTGYVGGYTSLAELHGKPAISYWNSYDDDLMFACYY